MSFPIYCKTGYWYIWYELYENDKKIVSGQYLHPGYKHKSSAVRAARKMWGLPRVDLMTGDIVTYKWIVSQTNPFSREE